jgi:hypothetical protein
MSRFALACCCAFSLGLAPAAAQSAPSPAPSAAPAAAATAPSPEAVKIAEAMAKITSFRMLMNSPNGVAGTVTVMIPQKRTKALMAFGTTTNEVVLADGRMYMRTNGGDWRENDTPAGGGFTNMASFKSIADAAKIRLLPDRVENGMTVGVYETTPPAPPGMPAGITVPTMTCTYDKTTHLPRTCTIVSMTQTFEGWNDPANVVEVPVVPGASPAPAASPHP